VSPRLIEHANLALLRRVAEHLGELREQVVFLGGAATDLLITDPAAGPVRATVDVDVVIEVVSRSAYSRIQQRLRRAGFVEDERPGAPLCRWVVDGIPVDVMPTDPLILGFANRWYPAVVAAPTRHTLREGPEIRLITGPLFVATKLEAFRQRGQSDLYGSRDLEDILAVVDGRAELVMECRAASSDVRSYLASALRKLMEKSEFVDALSGHLAPDAGSQGRIPLVIERIEAITRLG